MKFNFLNFLSLIIPNYILPQKLKDYYNDYSQLIKLFSFFYKSQNTKLTNYFLIHKNDC
jgi:hypothetical protein